MVPFSSWDTDTKYQHIGVAIQVLLMRKIMNFSILGISTISQNKKVGIHQEVFALKLIF